MREIIGMIYQEKNKNGVTYIKLIRYSGFIDTTRLFHLTAMVGKYSVKKCEEIITKYTA